MKTTIDLPDDLVLEVKLRAVREGRKLKDAMADLLRKGLSTRDPIQPVEAESRVTIDQESGLPLVHCKRRAAAARALTPERVSEILLDQEIAWLRETT